MSDFVCTNELDVLANKQDKSLEGGGRTIPKCLEQEGCTKLHQRYEGSTIVNVATLRIYKVN